jgi:hypothetical protein
MDIPDIKDGDELFSDGCGLMSKLLAMNLAKTKKIIFRNKRYTPTVFQIRYDLYLKLVLGSFLSDTGDTRVFSCSIHRSSLST